MHRETVLTPADLIWPLFVTDGTGVEEPVASLPGVSRWSVDNIARRAKEAVDLGLTGVEEKGSCQEEAILSVRQFSRSKTLARCARPTGRCAARIM